MVCAPIHGASARHMAQGERIMPNPVSTLRILLACFGLLLFAAGPAHTQPVVVNSTLFDFTANCEDCALVAGTSDYIVHGQLVLNDAYVLGTTILKSDFISFTYDGSNLYSYFTV